MNSLRNFSRIDQNNNQIISIEETARETEKLIGEIFAKEGVKIIYKKSSSSPQNIKILGNLGKFHQLVINLFNNAKDASKGKEDREIEYSIELEGETDIIFKVSDNGIGIAKDKLAKIFEPFYTTKAVGQGTGLGLGIVARITEELNGEISVSSELGVGTTFSLRFPKVIDLWSEKIKFRDSTPEIEVLKKEQRVLIVDDEEKIRMIFVELLELLGYQNISQAADGVEALELIKTGKFDFVFTDLNIPKMSGQQLIREISSLTLPTDPKLIVITGCLPQGADSALSQDIEALVSDTLEKPFRIEQVKKILEA